jgi:hypothetical protein
MGELAAFPKPKIIESKKQKDPFCTTQCTHVETAEAKVWKSDLSRIETEVTSATAHAANALKSYISTQSEAIAAPRVTKADKAKPAAADVAANSNQAVNVAATEPIDARAVFAGAQSQLLDADSNLYFWTRALRTRLRDVTEPEMKSSLSELATKAEAQLATIAEVQRRATLSNSAEPRAGFGNKGPVAREQVITDAKRVLADESADGKVAATAVVAGQDRSTCVAPEKNDVCVLTADERQNEKNEIASKIEGSPTRCLLGISLP